MPTLPALLVPSTPTFGRVLALVGVAIAAVLVAAAALLYRSDVETAGTYRIAGWNLLGAVVLGTVLVVAARYEAATVPPLVAAGRPRGERARTRPHRLQRRPAHPGG